MVPSVEVTLLHLHVDEDLHLAGLIRLLVAPEQSCVVSDQVREVGLPKDFVVNLINRHFFYL